jgi:UDP-2,3-diacylglucosamine pyrophosphatase LpxH
MKGENNRAYVLVAIQPGKEQEFANEIVSKRLKHDSKVERVDFVHGNFDFVITLNGTAIDIDSRIMKIRLLPYVQRTETLIPFQMLNWEEMLKKIERDYQIEHS